MIFRKATFEDVDSIMGIIIQAQEALKLAKIDQWQNQYPNVITIEEDIISEYGYVVEENHCIVATVAYSFDGDENYEKPVEGVWKTEKPYAVIHRIAVHQTYQGKGISLFLMQELTSLARERNMKAIRVDTHCDNIKMQTYLRKTGFDYMGIIRLKDGMLRDAFEKRIV